MVLVWVWVVVVEVLRAEWGRVIHCQLITLVIPRGERGGWGGGGVLEHVQCNVKVILDVVFASPPLFAGKRLREGRHDGGQSVYPLGAQHSREKGERERGGSEMAEI